MTGSDGQKKWYQTKFGTYVGLGLLFFGLGSGAGKFIKGYTNKEQRQVIEYKMDNFTYWTQSKKLDLIKNLMDQNEGKLTKEQIDKIMEMLSDK